MNLSIAMATFNGVEYIDEQLASLLRQTLLPDELIICDDGSTDGTLDRIHAFQKIAPFSIKLFNNCITLGYAQNFAKAISLCSGDIIFLCDQDDYWYHEKIRKIKDIFQSSNNTHVVINDTNICDGKLNMLGFSKLNQIYSLGLSETSFVTGCCSAFRRTIVPLILPIPQEEYAHDTWLHDISNRLKMRKVCHEILQDYRRHQSNTSQWIGSSTTKVNSFSLIKEYRNIDTRDWCHVRLKKYDLLADRIRTAGLDTLNQYNLGYRVEQALLGIEKEKLAVYGRLSILKMPRVLRLLPTTLFFLRGRYKYFSGWKSFLKDILQN
jgi:glycosyltransferase involved in cell wall biosynthesis